jgi:two-component system, cell cycle sensor histidine kinase and response regulator CckA
VRSTQARLSLRMRFVLIALVAAAPALLAIVYTQAAERRRAREETLSDSLHLTRLAAGRLAGVLDGPRRLLATLAHLSQVADADPRPCRALLPGILRDHPGYINITVSNADGSVFCSGAPIAPGTSVRGHAAFERALTTRKPAVGDYQVSVNTGAPAVVVAQPLLDDSGAVTRVLAVLVGVDEFNRIAADVELLPGASLTLFDRGGTILARRPDGPRWAGKRIPDSWFRTTLLANPHEAVAEAAGIDGLPRLYVIVPVDSRPDTGLYVGMGVDRATAFADADRISRQFVWLLGLVSIAAIVLAVAGSALFVSRPARVLTEVTRQIAAGDFAARARLAGGVPGLADLATGVNAMAAALESRQCERDRAEQELRASEDRYRLLFDHNPHPMWVFDVETLDFLEVNTAAVRLYGYTREEFLAMRVTAIRPAEDVDRLRTVVARAPESGLRSDRWRHRVKSGLIVDVDVTAIRFVFLGRPAAIVTVQDVTDRMRADEAIAERSSINAMMAEVGAALNQPTPLKSCLQATVDAVVKRLDAGVVRVWALSGDDDDLELLAGAVRDRDFDTRETRLALGYVGRVARDTVPLCLSEISAESGRTVAFAGHPLVVLGRPSGVLAVWGRHALSEAGRVALRAVADHIALAITRHQSDRASRHLASIVEASEDAIISKTIDGVILSWNAGAESLYGYTAAEAIGRPVSLIIPADRIEEESDLARRASAGRPLTHFETIRQKKEGTCVHVSLTLSPIRDDAGRISRVSSIARDITERRAAERALFDAEERMRFALEVSHVGIWDVDLRTGVSRWSTISEQQHGIAAGTFAGTIEAFAAAIHADDRREVLDAIDRAVRERVDANIVYRTIWPDGGVHWIRSIGRFVYDEMGNPVRGAGIAMDVTERQTLEEQFRQSQKMEAIGQLAGGIAHDFNNMLTAILGNAEFLADALPEDGSLRTDVEEIQKAATRAATLTHQLLAFSRKQMLAPTVLHVGDVVGGVTPMLRRLIGETISLNTTAHDRSRVKADRGQLEQVLVNLVVNARDAMRDGGVVTIETSDAVLDEAYARRHPGARTGPHVMIAVTDTGHGMDAATCGRVFEPFFTTKPQGQGTGLGLATVYGIVKQSGGSIWVYSEVGRGTTFKVYLPQTSEAVEASRAGGSRPHRPRGTETILVVEDEPAIGQLVEKALSRDGYTVHTIGNSLEAIEYAERSRAPIDLLLTDVVLPGKCGPELARDLQRLHPETKVLFMSGYTEHAMVHQGLIEAGIEFLPKPFSSDALTAKIREVLDQA